jgi:hypothetical protein
MHGGKDPVPPSRKYLEMSASFLGGCRLPQNPASNRDNGIGTEQNRSRTARRHGLHLRSRKPPRALGRTLMIINRFFDMSWLDPVRNNPDLGK